MDNKYWNADPALSAKDGDRPLNSQFSLHKRADLISRILVQLCSTSPATLYDTHCPQMPQWKCLWGDLSCLVLAIYNIESCIASWHSFIISGDLLGRVNRGCDLSYCKVGAHIWMDGWVTTQTPLTHHWLEKALSQSRLVLTVGINSLGYTLQGASPWMSWQIHCRLNSVLRTLLCSPTAFCAHLRYDITYSSGALVFWQSGPVSSYALVDTQTNQAEKSWRRINLNCLLVELKTLRVSYHQCCHLYWIYEC